MCSRAASAILTMHRFSDQAPDRTMRESNGFQVAIEYKVTDRLLFGSDFPVMTTREAVSEVKKINDWGAGVTLPRIRTS